MDLQFALKTTYEKLETLKNEGLVRLTAAFLYGCSSKEDITTRSCNLTCKPKQCWLYTIHTQYKSMANMP